MLSTLPGNLYGYSLVPRWPRPHRHQAVAAAIRSLNPEASIDDLRGLLELAGWRSDDRLAKYCRTRGVVDLGAVVAEVRRVKAINGARQLKVGYRPAQTARVRDLVNRLGLTVLRDYRDGFFLTLKLPDGSRFKYPDLWALQDDLAVEYVEGPAEIGPTAR